MNIRFTSTFDQEPGNIAELLKRSYADLVLSDPEHWRQEEAKWEEFDKEVFRHPDSVGACVFLTWTDNHIVGFGSFDPRQMPVYGIVGHNCILPQFQGRGIGKQQIFEIPSRLRSMGIQTAKASTNSHPFFVPAQRMYIACGFIEKGRRPWDRDPSREIVEYEKEI